MQHGIRFISNSSPPLSPSISQMASQCMLLPPAEAAGHDARLESAAYILFSTSERLPIPSIPDFNLDDGHSLQKSQHKIVPQFVHHNRAPLQTRGDHAPEHHPTEFAQLRVWPCSQIFQTAISNLETARATLSVSKRVQLGLRKVIQTQAWACHSTLFSQMRP